MRKIISYRTGSGLRAELYLNKKGRKIACNIWKLRNYSPKNFGDTHPVTSFHFGQKKWNEFMGMAKRAPDLQSFRFDLTDWTWISDMDCWAKESDTTAFLFSLSDLDELFDFDKSIVRSE